MMAFYYLLVLIIALIVIHGYYAMRICLFYHTVPRLPDITIDINRSYPRISIVVPIHNEESYLEEAITRLINMDYPSFEVIAVNDRSTDQSSEILKECQARSSNLKVIEIETLPEGWLGKTHAMQQALKASTGEYVLLTDADVLFHPSLLKHAIHYTLVTQLDHLALAPYCITRSLAVRAVILFQMLSFHLFFKPWSIKNSDPTHAIGIGAFNLFKKSSLLKIGGLEGVALNPIDDIGLGRLIKASEFKQDFISSLDWLKVEWYDSVKSLYGGLEKNIFAAFEFRLLPVILSQLCLLFVTFFPLCLAFLSKGVLQYLALLDIGIVLSMLGTVAYHLPVKLMYALTYPFTALVSLGICVGNVSKTILNGGIHWGNQFFSLKSLKLFHQHVTTKRLKR